MGTIGVIAVTYMTMQRAAINNKVNIQNKADKDVDDAAMKVGSYFLSPANCNANFYGKLTTGSLTPGSGAIALCPSGNDCSTGTGGTPITSVAGGAIPVMSPTSTDWSPAQTGISERVRVVGVNWSVTERQLLMSESGHRKAAILRVNVTFQKNLGMANGVKRTTNIVRSFDAFVVAYSINLSIPHPYLVLNSNINGCAWAPNSTNVYHN